MRTGNRFAVTRVGVVLIGSSAFSVADPRCSAVTVEWSTRGQAVDPIQPESSAAADGTVFFTARDVVTAGSSGRATGPQAGTAVVKDIRPGSKGSRPRSLTNVAGTLFFTADDGSHGQELWKSDGTIAGTVMVKDIRLGRRPPRVPVDGSV